MSVDMVRTRNIERQLIKYKKYSRDIKRLLVSTGLWPHLHPILQCIFSYYALATLAITFMGAFNFSLHYVSNVMVFTQTIGLSISLISSIMKICIFLLYRDDLANLNRYLSATFTQDLDDTNYRSLALYHYPAFGKLFYTLTTTVGMTIASTILISFLSLRHGKYVPVIPSLLPFAYEPESMVYWIIQIVHMWASFFVWTTTSGVDSAFGLYTLQICGEFRILSHKFEHLNGSKNYQNDLRQCIHKHLLLIKSKDTLEKIFGILSIWLAVTSAIIQCTLIFQVAQVLKSMNIVKFCYLIGFIFLKLVQAFMYSWYGNLITEESKLCLDAIYNASWAESGNQEFTKDVLIVLSQRPLLFRAKGCLNVTMEMFSKIVNTSVSYFFLLQTLESDI